MKMLSDILVKIDDFVWGPVMLILLVGTGVFLTIRTKALCWRNLPYALRSVLSKEARQKKGEGDVSPFSALTTALAATIGTGNIVGVATAMVSGGPGALVWMWISAAFGLTSKFSECMLAIKYREVNEKGEMSGGPMYTMKKAFKNKKLGAVLANVEVKKPEIPYVTNVTAEYVTDAKEIKELLVKQVSSSVKWQQCVEKMIAEGIDTFVEIGPGKTLSGFMRKINRNVTVMNIQNVEDFKKAVEFFEQQKEED